MCSFRRKDPTGFATRELTVPVTVQLGLWPNPSIRTCRRGKEQSPWDVSLPLAADRQDTFCATYSEPYSFC